MRHPRGAAAPPACGLAATVAAVASSVERVRSFRLRTPRALRRPADRAPVSARARRPAAAGACHAAKTREEVVEGLAPAVEVADVSEPPMSREQHEATAGCPVAHRISSAPIVRVHRLFLTTPPSILPSR